MEESTAATSLRLELKRWEKTFAAANCGRKPGREDIKNDAAISQKYKDYQNLRQQPIETHTTPKKRRSNNVLQERCVNTNSATHREPSTKSEPVQEEQPTPAFIRTALGPTPQKDGAILGIFDALLSATPSKDRTTTTQPHDTPICSTPSKASAPASSSHLALSRTPESSSKRFYLDAFAGTPPKRKREDELYTPSTTKRQFSTPSFLRRHVPTMAATAEDDEGHVATGLPFKKPGLVRSLSTIIQGLRKQEEQRMDDEWAVLQEMEAEEAGVAAPAAPAAPPAKILVEDSQAVEMPLGPDIAGESSEEETVPDPGALDANGNPRKVWKKKGLKRQTRRVIMRPVFHKPQKATDVGGSDSEGSVVGAEGHDEAGDASHSDDDDDDDVTLGKLDPSKKSRSNGKHHKGKQATDDHGSGDPKKKKKISAQAHANFRKLKIKSKNTKPKGRGGRFGGR